MNGWVQELIEIYAALLWPIDIGREENRKKAKIIVRNLRKD
jgi:hypothetical protein